MLPIELIAVVVTLLAVYLTTRQAVWCWPLGMISVTLYAVVFYQARLYADSGLQVLYFGLSAYGWWAWARGGENHGALAVSRASVRTMLLIGIAGGLGGALLGEALSRLTDASLPFVDSLLSAFSIVAQWMQTRKLLETWLVWLAVDVFYVGMFLYKGLYPTAALYAVFLYVQWRRSMLAPGSAVLPQAAA